MKYNYIKRFQIIEFKLRYIKNKMIITLDKFNWKYNLLKHNIN